MVVAGEGVCRLDETCCSEEAEKTFKVSTVKDYHNEVTNLLSGLIECHNQPLFSKSLSLSVCDVCLSGVAYY